MAAGATTPVLGTCPPGSYNSNHSESWLAVKPGTEDLVGSSKFFFEKYSTFYDFHLGAYTMPNGTPTSNSQVTGYDCISTGTQDSPPSWTNSTDPNIDFDTQRRAYQATLPFNAFWVNLHPNGANLLRKSGAGEARARCRRVAGIIVNMSEKMQPVVLRPGEGVPLAQSQTGGGVTLKVGAAETGGTLSIFESLRPAGDLGGPPLHRHDFDEAFYVLEGDYVIKVEERLINASVGSFVYIPRGTIHGLRHTGSGPGRLLTMCHPAGIEDIFAATGTDERAKMEKKYGAENVGPPLDASPT